MRLWSRGLGKSNVGIDFGAVQVRSLDEALDEMPAQAAELLSAEVSTDKLVTFSGTIAPTGWDFVILFERRDLLSILLRLLRSKHAIRLLSGDAGARKILNARAEPTPGEDAVGQ
jgi:hypothetical protein